MLARLIKDLLANLTRPSAPVSVDRIREAMKSGDLDRARALCDALLKRRPDDLDALHFAGTLAFQQGDRARAIELLTRAAESRTDAQPSLGLGYVLRQDRRKKDSIFYFRRAVEIEPDNYTPRFALAKALQLDGDPIDAEAHVRRAIALRPGATEALVLLAQLLYNQGRTEELAATVRSLQRVKGMDGTKIFTALLVPPIYQSTQEIDETRESLARRLGELLEGPPVSVSDPVTEIGITPFYLAYHGMNDCELQRRIAQVCRKAYRPAHSAPLAPRRRNGRLRIGFVSEHFNFHSVARVNHGLISGLRRDEFEVTVFSLARHDDAMARKIRADSDRYVEFDGATLTQIEDAIAGHEMDVLFYPDVGMDPLTYFLAYSRLAPLQCVAWGHPDTTGIDTLDYYISADALEVPEADSHYTEKLARLSAWVMPGYQRPSPPVPSRARATYGISDHTHLYVCPQAPFKLHPDFDQAIAAILRADPRGEVVFVEGRHPNLTEMLKRRFERSMKDVSDRIRILPNMQWENYLNLIAVSDVMLDPFHFGGANTTYEGLAMGIPVVTLPPRFLRGRHSLGCYLRMELMDCVAATAAEYSTIAVRLGTDVDYRRSVKARMHQASEVLFDNREMAAALGEFLLETCSTTQRA